MKLNKQGRDELRTQIEEQLKSVPEGQRIHLDKNLLEELLFETIRYNNIIIKAPFWSGKFLSKIDLSEIDFEDVSWTFLSDSCCEYLEKLFEPKECSDYFFQKSESLYKETKQKMQGKYSVDYSNTNAKIDFTKSAETKYSEKGLATIWEVNFSGTDLSNINFDNINSFYICDLSNTNMKISMDDINKRKYHILFEDCKLENIDLSKIIVSISEINAYFWDGGYFNLCTLKNTGLNIILNLSDKEYSDIPISEYKKLIGEDIKEGKLDGCYINGELIHSKEERQQIAQQKRQEYQEYKDSIVNDISSSIDEQISGIKK